jgi:hypothetical protein
VKSLTQLNTFSAQSVAYDDQGTGAQTLADRYQINGLLDTSKNVLDNIEKICSAAGSWLSYDIHEGRWGVVINTTGTSVASFDDSNILSNITVSGTGLNELYNNVKVEFPHRDLRDSADFVIIEIPDGDRNANEEDTTLNLTYDIINEPIQAQMLGLIELKQSRIDLIISFETDFSNIDLKAGDLIDVTNSRFGFSAKVFRIISTSEVQDDQGAIRISITALEYDANVYSVADLFRYTRTDENGIITIGNIGVPGTPQVTKFEIDSRPRILIETTAPTGVVEGIEFWLSEDTLLAEANRSYRLVAIERPPGGGVFTSGQAVSTEYGSLIAGDFVVKVRGFNDTTTGPFSTVSGIITFNPTQTTDAINPQTKSIDNAGNLLTLLGVTALLSSVDGLFGNDTNSTSSIFKKVFDLLKLTTGNDLLSTQIPIVDSVNPSSGPVEGGTDVIIYGEKFTGATSVTFDGTTSTFNVIDDGTIFAFTPQNSSGPASVIVTTPAGSNAGNALFTYIGEEEPPLPVPIITGINPNFGPIAGGTNVTISGQNLTGTTSIKFNNANLQNLVVVNSATITGLTPPGSTGTANLTIISPAGTNAAPGFFTYLGGTSGGGTGTLVVENFYPPDRETYQDPITGATSDTAPVAGSYYIKYAGSTLYGPLTKGSGNIQLYKSDGTLVQTLTAGQITIDNNVVGLPFSNRDFGTDYYILMEQGVVNYCSGFNSPISTPDIWNFNTPPYYVEPYNIESVPPQALPQIKPLVTNDSFNGYQMTLTYNSTIAAGSGNLYVYRASNNTLALTIPVSSVAIAGPVMVIPTFKDILQPGVSYYLTSDAGYVTSYVAIDCFFTTTSADALENIPFTMADQFALVNFIIDSSPFPFSDVRVNPQTYIGLEFNREVLFGQAGTISIYNASGTVYQAIDIKTNFNQNKTNELIWIANDQNAQTGNQNTVWINPTKDLTLDQTFYILATSGSVLSTVGDTWSGISGSDVVRFKIDPGPTATTTPISSVSRFIEMTFDRQIEPGTGEIAFIAGGVSLGSVDASDAAVTITSA